MQYRITKTYECRETTCGELVEKLNEAMGNACCIMSEFIDPNNPCDVSSVHECWSWIQARSPQKKLYLVDEFKSAWEIND
jgi:hypothetical protein